MGALHGYALSEQICRVSTLFFGMGFTTGMGSSLAKVSPYPCSDSCFTIANRLQDFEHPLGTINCFYTCQGLLYPL
jgi:hypothetical protein